MSDHKTPRARVAKLAGKQAGVVARRQVLALGVSRRQVDRSLASGTWLALLTGIYVLAGAPVTWMSWAWAGVLAAGDGSCLVGASAAAARGWADQTWPITIAISPERRLALRTSRIRVLRLAVDEHEIVRASGLPITNRLRTAVDVAHLVPCAQAQQLLDRWLVLERVDLAALADAINMSRRHGSRQARELMRAAADLAASQAERLAHQLLRAAGLGHFVANFPLRVAGRVVKIDIAFVGAQVAIEINGWAFHALPDRGSTDAAKVADLQLAGWLVLTFNWHDLVGRPQYVIAKVREALAARSLA